MAEKGAGALVRGGAHVRGLCRRAVRRAVQGLSLRSPVFRQEDLRDGSQEQPPPQQQYKFKLVDVPPDQVAARRFEFIGSDRLTDPIVVPGGQEHFREYCPDHVGCLAVEYAGRGEVRHVWPYRPDELEKWLGKDEFTADFPYEHAIGFSFLDHARIFGVSSYANGDLLAVFHFDQTHPYGGGVARIDRTGKPVWYRPDFSHHRPYLTDGEVVLVPGRAAREAHQPGLVAAQDAPPPPNHQEVMSTIVDSRPRERNRPCREAAEGDLRVRRHRRILFYATPF